MWILLEKRNAHTTSNNLSEYDCMGYANDEYTAMRWRADNFEYRTIMYCPKKEIT